MDRRLSRRKPASRLTSRSARPARPARLGLLAAAALLAASALGGCGFDQATNRENNIVNGTNDQDGTVDVLNAVIVSAEAGSGTFSATLANNSTDTAISLQSLSFGSNSTIAVAAFDPVEVPPHGSVNLSDGSGIKVSGDFQAGDFVTLSLAFDNGETTEMPVHVVTAEDEYDGLDNGTGTPSPAASPTAEESTS